MEARVVFLFCSLAAAVSADPPTLENDQPSLRIPISHTATIKCCYKGSPGLNLSWIQTVMDTRNASRINIVNETDRIKVQRHNEIDKDVKCSSLTLNNAHVSDIGLYQCILEDFKLKTPGTYLQVFVPIQKTLHISEAAKNSIITIQGVLLLLCVIIPGTMLICKSKGLHELEKRKGKEEENIYEGLNLDDCTSTYHQIQRSQVQGPYQDVINATEEEIQLEKP